MCGGTKKEPKTIREPEPAEEAPHNQPPPAEPDTVKPSKRKKSTSRRPGPVKFKTEKSVMPKEDNSPGDVGAAPELGLRPLTLKMSKALVPKVDSSPHDLSAAPEIGLTSAMIKKQVPDIGLTTIVNMKIIKE